MPVTIDAATLGAWIEGLGLEVEVVSDNELRVTRDHDDSAGLVVRRTEPGAWEVVHERRVSSPSLGPDWQAPWEDDPPAAVVDRAAREVAAVLPLIEATTYDDGADVVARFRAPVFEEDLSRQAFALTVSSVLKAAQVFDSVATRRAADPVAWREFEASSEQRRQELSDLVEPMRADAAPTITAGPPAVGWSPTHEPMQSARAWAQPDPAGPVVATIDRGVPVQLLERQGDWARVLCSNGWSAWVDGRMLTGS